MLSNYHSHCKMLMQVILFWEQEQMKQEEEMKL
jgi:hypothetical protein